MPRPVGPPDPADRTQLERSPVSLRRVLALFAPHRLQVGTVVALIVLSSLIALATPFLVRTVIDDALPQADVGLLAWAVAGMVAVAASTALLGVVQTWLSTTVGQRVMHGLRTSVFTHLQRQSLGFFTRTRGGEVQSRLTNDIGSMQSVVTSTATGLAANATTVVGTVVAMAALSWRLSLLSLVVLPPAIWLTRTVALMRREVTGERQRRMADMQTQVEEGLSISGVQLGKTLGTGPAQSERFARTSQELVALEVRSQLAGRWRMASMSIVFAGIPALIYLVAGLPATSGGMTIGTLVAFTALQGTLFRPLMGLLDVGGQLITSMALFSRVFEYLDLPVDIDEPARPVALPDVRGEVRLEHVGFSYDGARAALTDVDLVVPAGSTLALVGETGSGKSTLASLVSRLNDVTTGRVTIDGVDVRDLSLAELARVVGVVSQETYLLHTTIRENLRYAEPDATDAEIEVAAAGPRCTRSSRHCPTATTRWSVPGVTGSPAGRSSGWPSPARCCATRGCWSSTRPPARWTPGPSAPSRPPSTRSPAAGRRSPSRTGCPPSGTPTPSQCSTPDGSWSRAPTTSWSPPAAGTPCSPGAPPPPSRPDRSPLAGCPEQG